FLFQAQDGIRSLYVTGVQTCALPIFVSSQPRSFCRDSGRMTTKLSWRFAPRRRIILVEFVLGTAPTARPVGAQFGFRLKPDSGRSEEHTSELQSRRDLVWRLLFVKKK